MPQSLLWSFTTLVIAFTVIWIASDYILKSVVRLSRRVHMSSFAVSFLVLGMLTSLPEFAIGFNSILTGEPEVYVGNLIGASFVIFTLIIPLLAVFGNGISLQHNMSSRYLLFALFVIFVPALLTADSSITRVEGIAMILLYGILISYLDKKQSLLDKVKSFTSLLIPNKRGKIMDVVKIAAGAAVIFFASRILVNEAVILAGFFSISPLIIGLILLAVGTNIPELFIGVKSLLNHQKDVAFGDYLGSAAANTFIFGVMTVMYGSFTVINHFVMITALLFVGLGLFITFGLRKNDISRNEGLALLLIYISFLVVEIFF